MDGHDSQVAVAPRAGQSPARPRALRLADAALEPIFFLVFGLAVLVRFTTPAIWPAALVIVAMFWAAVFAAIGDDVLKRGRAAWRA